MDEALVLLRWAALSEGVWFPTFKIGVVVPFSWVFRSSTLSSLIQIAFVRYVPCLVNMAQLAIK